MENTLYNKHNSKLLPMVPQGNPAHYTNSLISKEHFLFSDHLIVLFNNHQITKSQHIIPISVYLLKLFHCQRYTRLYSQSSHYIQISKVKQKHNLLTKTTVKISNISLTCDSFTFSTVKLNQTRKRGLQVSGLMNKSYSNSETWSTRPRLPGDKS